jgi:hypothetical protein
MTEWQTKIYDGMKLLQEGCELCTDDRNARCKDCPFDKICDEFFIKCGAPDSWIGIYITKENNRT